VIFNLLSEEETLRDRASSVILKRIYVAFFPFPMELQRSPAKVNEGVGGDGVDGYSQHFQVTQRSESPVFDAADVVVVQLAAHTHTHMKR